MLEENLLHFVKSKEVVDVADYFNYQVDFHFVIQNFIINSRKRKIKSKVLFLESCLLVLEEKNIIILVL